MSDQLPDDVRRFVSEHINSVEQLEVLLLLKSRPDHEWTAADVSQELYTTPAAAAMRLDDLRQRGFIWPSSTAEPAFHYRPSGDVDRSIAQLAELYKERRVTIISLIYSKPHQQVQAFADAFKIRKDPEKDR